MPLSTLALQCVYGLGVLFFGIAFLVDCIRLRRYLREYLAVGLVAAAIAVAIDIPVVIIADLTGASSLGICCLLGDVWVFGRVVVIAVLGMHYSAVLRRSSFALLAWLRRERGWPMGGARPASDSASLLTAPTTAAATSATLEESTEEESSERRDIAPEPWWSFSPIHDSGWRPYLVELTAVLVGMIGYSIVLFLITRPTTSALFTDSSTDAGEAGALTVVMGLFVALAYAFSEEIFFRLGIQRWLATYLGPVVSPARLRFWLPIGLSTFLWTVGHAGALEPEWVKLAQIFPIGLALGWLYERRGVESTVIAHLVFNVVMVALSSWLIA